MQSPFFVKIAKEKIRKRKTEIRIGIYEDGKRIRTAETTFMGPAN
jgi:hypothetical protein